MNDFNHRFDFDIGLDVSNKKSNTLVVILGYYDSEIYIKTAYPMPKHITLGKHTSYTMKTTM